jgi:hypothetical protein
MTTITEQIAYAQFYASIYAGSEPLKVKLETKVTTEAFERMRGDALPSFYAAVLVFFVKAKAYFQKTSVGKYTFSLQRNLLTLMDAIRFPRRDCESSHTIFNQLRALCKSIEQSLKKLEGLANAAGMERQKGTYACS